jgi:hypothetical protein
MRTLESTAVEASRPFKRRRAVSMAARRKSILLAQGKERRIDGTGWSC